MSFKIFSLQLTGKIKPVSKIEQQRNTLLKDYNEFLQVENSDELKEFIELEQFINSSEFKKVKTEISGLQFKGSNEYNQLLEFEKLKKSKKIKNYFKVLDSADLKRYEKLKDAEIIKEYDILKSYIQEGYQKDKINGKKEETIAKRKKYKSLAGNPDVRFFQKYQKSSLLRNYLDVCVSHELEKFNDLKKITGSTDFLEKKAYLEDKNKWGKTVEFQKQKKYEEIKGKPHIVKYFKYKNSSAFDFYKLWEVVFEEDFSSTPDRSKWLTVKPYAEKTLGENFSMPGDYHTFTNGKNIKTDGKLIIEVKKEKTKGKIWKMDAGFIPSEFEYTSDMVSTAQSFLFDDGIVEAKIKFNPVKEVVSSFVLTGDKQSPRINLLEMGTKNRLGVSKFIGNGKIEVEGLDISNLHKGKTYIFGLEKSGKTLIWKINETEVLRLEKNEFNFPVYFEASAIPVFEIAGHNLPVKFEIDWIKYYRKK
jgi:hypothetical protein